MLRQNKYIRLYLVYYQVILKNNMNYQYYGLLCLVDPSNIT